MVKCESVFYHFSKTFILKLTIHLVIDIERDIQNIFEDEFILFKI